MSSVIKSQEKVDIRMKCMECKKRFTLTVWKDLVDNCKWINKDTGKEEIDMYGIDSCPECGTLDIELV